MRKILPVILICICGNSFSQQLSQFSQYWNFLTYDNPAACGKSKVLNVSSFTRKQWLGVEGSPFTTSAGADIPFTEKKFAIGIVSEYDIIGFYRTFETRFQGAYLLPITNGQLHIGLETGLSNFRLNNPQWVSIDPLSQDPAIPQNSNDFGFGLGSGVFYHNENFYTGLSVRNLFASRYKNSNYSRAAHYYLQAGYRILLNTSMMIMPTLIVKSNLVSTQLDVNTNFFIGKRFHFGIGYRISDAVILNIGYQLPQWKFGYAWDITTSSLQVKSRGSHELFIRFLLNKDSGTVIQ